MSPERVGGQQMKLGVLSDIHGNSIGLGAVLAAIESHGVEQILIAGDLVGYYPYVNEVFDMLRPLSPVCIRGNHDSYLVGETPVSEERWSAYSLDFADRTISTANRNWLAALPEQRRLDFGTVSCCLCHGSPWSADEYVYPDQGDMSRFGQLCVDLVVMGHTHIPFAQTVDGTVVMNPGSCGQPRDFGSLASCAVVETDPLRVHLIRVPYDVDSVCSRVLTEGLDPALADILQRGQGDE